MSICDGYNCPFADELEITEARNEALTKQCDDSDKELIEALSRIKALEKAARAVVDTMRGSGGITPKAAVALVNLAALLEGED